MKRSRAISVLLLTTGGLSVASGMFLWLGLGAGLITFGALLIAAELLVPTR